jgi:hypothetical protein
MSSEFSGPTSYYDTVMDMCLPCGDARCVFPEGDSDQTWIMQAARRAQGGARKVQAGRRALSTAGTPFPPCDLSAGTITDCYFQEDGDAPSDVDVCYETVFGSEGDALPPPDWEGNNQPYTPPYFAPRSGAVKPATAVAQARVQQCPFYVCAAQTYRGGNGIVAFDHASCKCASAEAARAVRR